MIGELLHKGQIYSIELCQYKHMPEILSIEKRSFPENLTYTRRLFTIELKKHSHFVILNRYRQLIAYYGIHRFKRSIDLINLGIQPARRSQGFGRAVLEYVLKYYQEKKFKQITLNVACRNVHAFKLYMSVGFEVDEVLYGYYGDHDL